jgi:NTP pyrophosphatase (non-canonical NTP hydrolase)
MSADRPIEQRKPLSEYAAVPLWVLEKISGEVAAQLNLRLWQVEGPRLCWPEDLEELERFRNGAWRPAASKPAGELTFAAWREANVARCLKWHPQGIESWSPSDWMTAVTGEMGELASLLKMRNRERDGLPGNKFSPTLKQIADEIADVFAYLDLLAAALGIDLAHAAVTKFNEVSERVGFPDRIYLAATDTITAVIPEQANG